MIGVLNEERGIPGIWIERASHDPLGEQTRLLENLPALLPLEPQQAFDQIGGGWVGEEAVAGALYCFLRTPHDFRTTVLTAANASLSDTTDKGKGGCDSDSIACIAGSISGAFNGIGGIPKEWIEGVENQQLLTELGQAIAQSSQRKQAE